jgi:manganese efflux pump family protein
MDGMIQTLLLAAALSMDAFAVSIGTGVCIPGIKPFHAIRASLAFGLFQFAMPILGWLLGDAFRSLIQGFDHWIAFGLLALVGGKMIVESFEAKDPSSCSEEERARGDIRNPWTLLVLAVATSIDALAVGLTYNVLGTPILAPAAVIGIVTFALCAVGIEFGKRIGARFERWSELAGGLVLVGIGAKMLIEHFSSGS